MQKLRNLKHIFVVIILALSAVFANHYLPKEYTNIFNGTFIYRTGENAWQDKIYAHTLRPSKKDIAIIRIDNESLNALQAKGNLKMLTIPKSYYVSLIEKLENAGVKGIGIDIIFENADKDEELFAKTLKKYKNIVIASEYKKNPVCIKDQTGSYMNCSGSPRSVYRDVPWGIVSMDDAFGYQRITHADIGSMPYASWFTGTGNSVKMADLIIDTLPLALYAKVEKLMSSNPYLSLLRDYTLNPYFG